MVTVDTPRLWLRPLQASDAEPLLEIHQDPEAARYVLQGTTAGGITHAWRIVAMLIGHWHLRGYGQWAVVEKASGEVIGRVGLWHPAGAPAIALGWIIRRARWGNGFATEAALAALTWTWEHVAADHIVSVIQPDNAASIRVAQTIGERFERHDVVNGQHVSLYGIPRNHE